MPLFKNPIVRLSAIVIIITVALMFFIFSLKNKIESEAAQLQEKRNVLEILEKRDENFLDLKNTDKLVKKNLPIVKNMIPDEKNIEEFVIALENIATKTNNKQFLIFDSVKNSKQVGEKINSLEFSITLTGNSHSFTDYLEEFKKLPYFIETKSVTIENSAGITDNNSQMNLKSEIYIRK